MLQVCALVLGICVVHVSCKFATGMAPSADEGFGWPETLGIYVLRNTFCQFAGFVTRLDNLVTLAPISCDLLFASGDANEDAQTQDEDTSKDVDPSPPNAPGLCSRAGYLCGACLV